MTGESVRCKRASGVRGRGQGHARGPKGPCGRRRARPGRLMPPSKGGRRRRDARRRSGGRYGGTEGNKSRPRCQHSVGPSGPLRAPEPRRTHPVAAALAASTFCRCLAWYAFWVLRAYARNAAHVLAGLPLASEMKSAGVRGAVDRHLWPPMPGQMRAPARERGVARSSAESDREPQRERNGPHLVGCCAATFVVVASDPVGGGGGPGLWTPSAFVAGGCVVGSDPAGEPRIHGRASRGSKAWLGGEGREGEGVVGRSGGRGRGRRRAAAGGVACVSPVDPVHLRRSRIVWEGAPVTVVLSGSSAQPVRER